MKIWKVNIEIRKHLKVEFQIVWLSNGQTYAMAIVQLFENQTIWNSDIFVKILNVFRQNGSYLFGFHTDRLLDFRSHWKSGPFATQPLFDHSSRLVQISHLRCVTNLAFSFLFVDLIGSKDERITRPNLERNYDLSKSAQTEKVLNYLSGDLVVQ